LRVAPIPSLRTVTIVFVVSVDTVTVLRIGYLGQIVLEDLPNLDVDNPIDVSRGDAA